MSGGTSSKQLPVGSWIVLGLLVGTVVGLVLGELGLWIAIGTMAGAVADGAVVAQRRRGSRGDR